MTKTTTKPKPKEETAQDQEFSEVLALVERPDFNKKLDTAEGAAAMRLLTEFAAADSIIEQESVNVGEFFEHFLSKPIDEQKPFVWKLADFQGVERPTYAKQEGAGRPSSGQKELSQVLYAKFPKLLEKNEGKKDTLASKRISDHRKRYRDKIALPQQTELGDDAGEQQQVKLEISRSAMKKVFVALWHALENATVADTIKAQKVLMRFYSQLGVDDATMNKWVEGEVYTLYRSEDIINVHAHEVKAS